MVVKGRQFHRWHKQEIYDDAEHSVVLNVYDK